MSFSIEDIYVYIFSWKHVTANALELYKRVALCFPNTYFINCDENITITDISAERVIQRDDSYYYGGQFQTAIRHMPEGKILGCIVGDVSPDAQWNTIAINSIDAFNTENAGIYAPNVHVTGWTSQGPPINISKQFYSVENPDCTCWFIHPNISATLKCLNYFEICNLGWGIDIIFCNETTRKKQNIIRDYSTLVNQPPGTNYDHISAEYGISAIHSAYHTLIGYVVPPPPPVMDVPTPSVHVRRVASHIRRIAPPVRRIAPLVRHSAPSVRRIVPLITRRNISHTTTSQDTTNIQARIRRNRQ